MEIVKNEQPVIPWIGLIQSARLRFFYTALSTGFVEYFLGTEIRGSIGIILKTGKGCTKDKNEDCKNCDKKEECVYIKNFDKNNLNHISKCFHLKMAPSFRCIKTEFVVGETIQFDMVFFGHSVDEIRNMVMVLGSSPLRLGTHGLKFKRIEVGIVTRNGHCMPVHEMEDINESIFLPVVNPDNRNLKASCIQLDIHTPAEISYEKGKFLQNPEQLTFDTLVTRMLNRIGNVEQSHFKFHKEKHQEIKALEGMFINYATGVHLVKEMMNARWQRVKFRNKPGKKFGGITGRFVYKGDLSPYLDLLDATSCLGLGKNTTSGFGHCSYQILQ